MVGHGNWERTSKARKMSGNLKSMSAAVARKYTFSVPGERMYFLGGWSMHIFFSFGAIL